MPGLQRQTEIPPREPAVFDPEGIHPDMVFSFLDGSSSFLWLKEDVIPVLGWNFLCLANDFGSGFLQL